MKFASGRWGMGRLALGLVCAILWCTSLYPAARLSPALPLLMTPLAGMVCDAPQTPCLRVLGGYYLIFLVALVDLGSVLLSLFVPLRTSWKIALSFTLVNWILYVVLLPPDWRP